MTIEKDPDKQYFSCDTPGCTAEYEFDKDDFKRAWNMAKLQGWETKKIAGEWLHACPRHML